MSEQSSQKEIDKPVEMETEKLSAIRDIIFGNEIQEYNKEFNEIKDIISKNKGITDNDIQKLEAALNDKIDKLQQLMEQKMSDMEAQFTQKLQELDDRKTDRAKLGDLLEAMAKELKA